MRHDSFEFDEFEVAHQRAGDEKREVVTVGHEGGVVAGVLHDEGVDGIDAEGGGQAVDDGDQPLTVLAGSAFFELLQHHRSEGLAATLIAGEAAAKVEGVEERDGDTERGQPRHNEDAHDERDGEHPGGDRLGNALANYEPAHRPFIDVALGGRRHVGALPRRVEHGRDVARGPVPRGV